MNLSRTILWAGFILLLLIMGYYVDAFRHYHMDGLNALQSEISTTRAKYHKNVPRRSYCICTDHYLV
jgi:hypothetical protein